jgi:uncharacterized membrane protein (DUF4010 family)
LAGFFSGFVSSTLAVASFGSQVKQSATLISVASAGALLANLASLLLMAAILAAAAPNLMIEMLWPLLSGAAILTAAALFCLFRDGHRVTLPEVVKARSFKLTHALSIAMIIAAVIVLTAWLREQLGEAGALVTVGLVALVELQAAAASIAQLNSAGALESRAAQWGVLIVLAAASIAKTVLAFVSGGTRYGFYVGGGLMLMVAVTLIVMLL